MKDKLLKYIEKLQPLLEKIKPWIKTKKAWIQIGLSLVAIICLILAGVSSCSRRNVNGPTPKATATAEATEKATATPKATASPLPTELPATATPVPATTESTGSSNGNSSANSNPTATEKTSTSSSYVAPTGAPLYTPIPEESVDTRADAYRTVVQSSNGLVDQSSYYLYDMDSDGVEELILHSVYDELTASIEIYTYSEDGLVFVGDAAGCYASISGCSRGGIIVYYRRDGFESIENIVKTDYDMYPNTLVLGEYVNEYTVMDTDVPIEAHRIDDLSYIK